MKTTRFFECILFIVVFLIGVWCFLSNDSFEKKTLEISTITMTLVFFGIGILMIDSKD